MSSFCATGARNGGRAHHVYDQVSTGYSATSILPCRAHIREETLYEQIDPNLLRESSSPGVGSQCWQQVPVPSSYFQQSPTDICVDPELTHDTCNDGMYHQAGCARNGSPSSFRGSPVFSLTKSPSIGSDGSYDVVTDPPTPPDARGTVISLGTPYDSDYYEPSTKQQEVSYYPGSQDEDVHRHAANPTYYNVESHEFNGQYMFDVVTRCNSLGHISSAHGAHVGGANASARHYSPSASLSYTDSARHIKEESMPPNTEMWASTTGGVRRRNRTSQYRYDPISAGHEVSSQGDGRRRVYSANKKFCHKCKKHFPSRALLDEHAGMVHPRPFICVFHYAGCSAKFDAKNEWKRHVSTKHLGLKYWVCVEGKCCDERQTAFQQRAGLVPKGNIFNRKDLYTQHIRRMHSDIAGQSTTDYKGADARSDFMVKRMQEDALRIRCRLPTWMPCPVKSCDNSFKGSNAWDERMEHVAQQHFENAANGKEPPVEFGGLHDYVLTEWAQRSEICIVKQTDMGWELCDPLKGGTEYRIVTATSEGEA